MRCGKALDDTISFAAKLRQRIIQRFDLAFDVCDKSGAHFAEALAEKVDGHGRFPLQNRQQNAIPQLMRSRPGWLMSNYSDMDRANITKLLAHYAFLLMAPGNRASRLE